MNEWNPQKVNSNPNSLMNQRLEAYQTNLPNTDNKRPVDLSSRVQNRNHWPTWVIVPHLLMVQSRFMASDKS